MKETILNQEHGSAFDLWVQSGAQPMSSGEVEWMKRHAEPTIHIYQVNVTHGSLPYAASLAPQEVRLVEFIPEGAGYSPTQA